MHIQVVMQVYLEIVEVMVQEMVQEMTTFKHMDLMMLMLKMPLLTLEMVDIQMMVFLTIQGIIELGLMR